ncbi:MAG: hypothetical protein RCG15_04165 [Candidatus Rickettsia vulgarisii]
MLVNNKKSEIIIDNYQQLSDHYKKEIKANLNDIKEISKDLNIISKYSNISIEFKQGEWVKNLLNQKKKIQ